MSSYTHIQESRTEAIWGKERHPAVGSRMQVENQGVDTIEAHDLSEPKWHFERIF